MKVVTRYKFQLPFCIIEKVYGNNVIKVGTVWRIIFVGTNFRGKSVKRPSKLIFVVLNFVIATIVQGHGTAAQAIMYSIHTLAIFFVY